MSNLVKKYKNVSSANYIEEYRIKHTLKLFCIQKNDDKVEVLENKTENEISKDYIRNIKKYRGQFQNANKLSMLSNSI